MADDDEIPWYAPGATVKPMVYMPHLREHVWILTERGKGIDAELLFHGESYGSELQCVHDGVMAYAQRFALREDALNGAEAQRQRLMGESWAAPA
jgi:hypothetical protein